MSNYSTLFLCNYAHACNIKGHGSFNHISFMQIVSIIYGALYFWLSSLALSSHHHVYNGKRFVSFYPCIVILEQDPCIHSLNKNSSRCHAASAVLAMLHYGIFSFSGSCHSWLQKFFRLELWELGTLKILAEQFCYYFCCRYICANHFMLFYKLQIQHGSHSWSCPYMCYVFLHSKIQTHLPIHFLYFSHSTVCHYIFIPVLSSPHSLVFGSSIHTENLPLDTRNIWHALFIAEPLYEANAN